MQYGTVNRASAPMNAPRNVEDPARRAPRLTPAVQHIDPRPQPDDSVAARAVAQMPRYVPQRAVSGTIRLWGHGNRALPWMRHLIDQWQQGLAYFHPNLQLDYHLYGTSSGIPALYNGLGDIALLGEEILPAAAKAFERVKGYPPTGIELMTGSLDIRNFDFAQAVFVHRDNPIEHISLTDLDGVLGTEHRRGGKNIRRWGDLGVGGAWTLRTINPYSWSIDDSFGFYLQNAVLEGSHRWNPAVRGFAHIHYPDGAIYDHGQQILDALATDPAGIAISNIRYAVPAVKMLPLSITPDGPFVLPSDATLIDQTYPLTRTLPAVIDRAPDGCIDPKVYALLCFILSREGQEAINRDGRYLPLSNSTLLKQRRALGPGPSAPTLRQVISNDAPQAPEPPIRIWGTPALLGVARRWAQSYGRSHPDTGFEFVMKGSDSAIHGLTGGVADIALMGRSNDDVDDNGFSRPKTYPVTRIEVATGSLSIPGKSDAIALLVPVDNPLGALSLDQLARILAEGRETLPHRTWDAVGLEGTWADRPINVYTYDFATRTGRWLQDRVTRGNRQMCWDRIREYRDRRRSDGTLERAADRVGDAARRDPDSLAIANAAQAHDGLKLLAISDGSGPYVLPSEASIAAGRYPLSRHAYAFVDRRPGTTLPPDVLDFLRFALSPQGQSILKDDSGYLRLPREIAREQIRTLEAAE